MRLYHGQGLLIPAYVDPSTSYRYYLTEQLWKARLIHLMRKMDMPLEEAKQVLELAEKGRIRAVFQIQRYLESYQSRLQAATEVSNDLIAFLNKEKKMPFEVSTTNLPAQKVLAIELKMKAAGLGEKIYYTGKTGRSLASPVAIQVMQKRSPLKSIGFFLSTLSS